MAETYFITGATGLIGGAITQHLVEQGENVVVYVRNEAKAKELFANLPTVSIIEGSLEQCIIYDGDVDYIIHAAAPTNSTFFMENPVETIDSIVLGTRSILNLAKTKKVKSVVNLSSMEMYGISMKGELITEEQQFYLDPLSIRSNYPIAKRLTENMCVAYATEYNVPVKTARLAQVIGKTLLPDDNRVIAQFIRSAKDRTDIVLATDGSTRQTYIGIDDAVNAILTILHKGENGQSYNVANDSTYCSIREMAEIVARDVAGGAIDVVINPSQDGKYPPTRTLRLSSDKLNRLGWSATTSLKQSLEILHENEVA